MDKFSYLVKEKPGTFLVAVDGLEKPYASNVAEVINTTYSHTIKVKQNMEKHGLITTQKEGRKEIIELTEEGKQVLKGLDQILEGMNLEPNIEEQYRVKSALQEKY